MGTVVTPFHRGCCETKGGNSCTSSEPSLLIGVCAGVCPSCSLGCFMGSGHVSKFFCPPSAQIKACCWCRLRLALPWLPGCSIYRSGGGRCEGIILLLGGLRPSLPTDLPPPLPLPSFQQKTRDPGLQEPQPQVLAPLGLCLAHPSPPTSRQRHGKAVCGWEPCLAHGLPASSCQLPGRPLMVGSPHTATLQPLLQEQQTALRLKRLGGQQPQSGHCGWDPRVAGCGALQLDGEKAFGPRG